MDPQISFTFDPESPIVGDPFTATCSAEISPEVTGSIQLEWRNEVGATIATSGGNNSAVVSFTIESYSMDDGTVIGGFNCRAAILAEDEMRNYEIVLGRNILFTCEDRQHYPSVHITIITTLYTFAHTYICI